MSMLRAVAASPRLAAMVLHRRLRETDVGVSARDLSNRVRFGASAPRVHERIWVEPAACRTAVDEDGPMGPYARALSGQVKGGDWDLAVRPIEQVEKLMFGLRHWGSGLTWEETGAYDHLLHLIAQRDRPVDRCLTGDDVVSRYEELDRIFAQVREEGRLRTRVELVPAGKHATRFRLQDHVLPRAVRERKGILIHIGRNLEPIYGGGSSNRLAMAIALELPRIPAHLGRIHREALTTWRGAFAAGAEFPE